MRVNQTCTGRRDSNGRSQVGRFRAGGADTGKMLIRHAALAAAVEDAFPGLIEMQPATRGGPMYKRWDSLASVQAALPAPGIPRARVAFSPAKGIATGYPQVLDA